VRPGVFDGGYAFMSQIEPIAPTPTSWLTPVANRGAGYRQVPLPAGKYVVRVVPPRGYKIVKEEDKNVDFGDEYIPQEFNLPGYPLGDGSAGAPTKPGAAYEPLAVPFCVGSLHEVADELALFPDVATAYGNGPGVPGDQRPLCDQKLVTLRAGQNPGANFFLFTEAPVAGHITGFVLDDTANEFDPNSPQFGEKYAPPFMPISIRDWKGREIASTHTDEFGSYNVLVPSTFTANQPIPSGMSPSMLTTCINSPTSVNAAGQTVANPHHYKQYSHFCYTLNFMPGTTTYLDTPVLPTGAFTGIGQFPVDAELPSGSPVIAKVTNIANLATGVEAVGDQIGPYIVDRGAGLPGTRTIDITSAGMLSVPNPAYDGLAGTQPKTILRDYTFGAVLSRLVVKLDGTAIPAANVTIPAPEVLRVVVPSGSVTNQLTVERCHSLATFPACTDSRKSVLGVTLTVATPAMHAARPPIVKTAGQTIQQAIDAAPAGALVMVPPGTYEESVVMKKPVRLQGWGALSTVINSVNAPAEKLEAWRQHVVDLLNGANGADYLLAGQIDILGLPLTATDLLAAGLGGEAAGVTVFGRPQAIVPGTGACLQNLLSPFALLNEAYCLQNENTALSPVQRPNARIDGFSIIGTADGAGIMVNANARYLDIGNNRITNNVGDFAGGVRVGQAGAIVELADEDALNHSVSIHNNVVAQNAGLDAAGGGGIVIGNDADNYRITDNFIAGNFTGGRGAGVSHIGRSPGGVIDRNSIVFNEGFNQGLTRSGGGLFIGGTPPAAGALTPGSGSVRVSNNLIQGNMAASGDGGGVALDGVNGGGPDAVPADQSRVALYNNIIVNNATGLAGGGVSLHDAAFVEIIHNTIARNDSFATAGGAFLSGDTSTPQPAGIVSRAHTPGSGLPGTFSNPTILNSIVFENRSFFFGPLPGGVQNPGVPAQPTYGLDDSPAGTGRVVCPIAAHSFTCWDLGVLGGGGPLTTTATTLTGGTPSFVTPYANGSRNPTIVMLEQGSILVPAAFDEGGTFVRPIFGPLTLQNPTTLALTGNYHVTAGVDGSSVPLNGLPVNVDRTALIFDIDGDARPTAGLPATSLTTPDQGADEFAAAALPAVSVNDVTVTEGNAGTTVMTFTVSLSSPATNSIDLRYSTTNGTAIGGGLGCTPGVGSCDYESIPANTVLPTFLTGETSKTISVLIKGDLMYEGNQTFNLVVSLAPLETDATIADGTGVGTIVDNDPIPTLTINDPAAVQEPNVTVNSNSTIPITFTITLTGAHEQASSVLWSAASGTATGGLNLFPPATTDFFTTLLPSTASFAATTTASQTAPASVSIRRNGTGDTAVETFSVNLQTIALLSPINAVIVDAQGIGTITDRP
jgi:large repetitive protein